MSSVPLGNDSEVARAVSPKVSYAEGKGIKERASLPICSSKGFGENQPAMVLCLGTMIVNVCCCDSKRLLVQGEWSVSRVTHTHSWSNAHFDSNQAYKAQSPMTSQTLLTARTIHHSQRTGRFSFWGQGGFQIESQRYSLNILSFRGLLSITLWSISPVDWFVTYPSPKRAEWYLE